MEGVEYSLLDLKKKTKINFKLIDKKIILKNPLINIPIPSDNIDLYMSHDRRTKDLSMTVPKYFTEDRKLVSYYIKGKEKDQKFIIFDKKEKPSNGDIILCNIQNQNKICRLFRLYGKIVVRTLDNTDGIVFNNEDVNIYGTAVGIVKITD